MSVFTVVIIIWVIYQLGVSLMKKGKQQTPGNSSDPLKLPDVRAIREALQGTSPGTWREQLKQAMENDPYQAGSLQATEPKDSAETKDYYVETEGTQGVEGTSEYIGILGLEAYKSAEETPSEEKARNSSELSGVSLSLTERELVQGVMWAAILGKPRARGSFKGSRT
jgi:hypothetical protein